MLCSVWFEREKSALAEAAELFNVEEAWSIACRIATNMLNTLCGQSIPASRGQTPSFLETKIAASKTSTHSPLHSFAKARKLCHEIRIKLTRMQQNLQVEKLWTTARNLNLTLNRHGQALDLPQSSSCLGQWTTFLELAESALCGLKSFCQERSRCKRARWKRRMRVSTRSDRKAVHRWLRDEPLGFPKAFKTPDGFTCDPNKMLSMLTTHMSAIYNFHADKDVASMVSEFRNEYQQSIQAIKCHCSLPELSHWDVFRLVQKRPVCKAGGLDGWLTRELKHLPPVGWKAFVVVKQLAECVGEWPQTLRTISVSSISKGLGNSSPEVTRAIGVSSVVYSVWSSLRFRQLSQWHLDISPASLYGGLQGRKAQDSELSFSHDLHSNLDDHLSVFIDRWKCFDLIIPGLAISIASDLGLPSQVAVAARGFYCNQVNFLSWGPTSGTALCQPMLRCKGVACQSFLLIPCSRYCLTMLAWFSQLFP